MVGPTRPILCPDCAIALAEPERRDVVLARLLIAREERRLTGSPPGTLIGFELPAGDAAYYIFGVGVTHWPLDLQHFVLPWTVPGCPRNIVVLSVIVSIGWTTGPKRILRWWWESPHARPIEEYIENTIDGVAVPPTHAEWDRLHTALQRLHRIADDAKRPRGTTTYTKEHFRERVDAETQKFEDRHGRPPYGTELARILGVSESTFKRYKKQGWLSGSTPITDTF